ncbi:putative dehydrogenase [Alkalihalobacillus xiaoxiensis]|uniref:Dehydrogenase n=1 Tax=Shouchella xiaoxiensis TaxID=766895 RepID=A0ABS2SVF2_9BACI|nr:Gfo/Idh/MocA family oxidoreductase [Shouchella xiaoxiensis]MBM7839492.1 putative dehydrogenase [Shouchella xiaoxiensis]
MTQTLNWGILGTATIAKGSMIPGIKESQTGVVKAVASRSLEKAQAFASELEIETAYGTYEELLADPTIDAVYIPLPNHLHKEWVIRAAEAKKHVLCEKPISLNSEELVEMKQACETHGVLLLEAFMYRYQERYAQIKTQIESGAIGELRGIRSSFTFNNAGDLDNFRVKKEYGGGSLYDIGVYPLSLARMIFGEEPEAITVHPLSPASHNHVDMSAAGLVEFANGRFLTFDCGMWAAFRNDAEILGTTGRIFIPNAFTGGSDGYELYQGNDQQHVDVEDTNHYAKQADFFAQVLSGEVENVWDVNDSLENMRLLDGAMQSQDKKERVVLR